MPLVPYREVTEADSRVPWARLGMLYQSTCVGFRVRSGGGCFLELLRCPRNPVTEDNLWNSSPAFDQPSTKLASLRARAEPRSLLSAFASICRMRSRVNPRVLPISSSV